MSDETKIKYTVFMKGFERLVDEDGLLLNSVGSRIFCLKCCIAHKLDNNKEEDQPQLIKLGAYFKEYEERVSVKCGCCGRVVVDDFEKLKSKELII